MLKIRLQRVGRVHEPSFRLVLTDSKNATKTGRFKEVLGSYDPRKSRDLLKGERIQYWISKGAGLTPSVHNLLVNHKIISGPKIHVSKIIKAAPVENTENAIIQEPTAEAADVETKVEAEAL